MEKEQDAIVMRLLREIDILREENSRLRRNMGHLLNGEPLSPTPPQSRRSSVASLRQQQLFGTSGSMASTPSSSRRSSFSQIDNLKSDLQKKRNSACNYPITLSSSATSPFANAAGIHVGKPGAYEYVESLSVPAAWPAGPDAGSSMTAANTRGRRRRQSNEPSVGGSGVRLSKVPNRTGYTVL
ncbi:AaceriADL362Cp [[Ashbya] aceris (nom. inval.)]|nr:AaceriADL362Cp [[Ashbya] aceris (nom. inval.)]